MVLERIDEWILGRQSKPEGASVVPSSAANAARRLA